MTVRTMNGLGPMDVALGTGSDGVPELVLSVRVRLGEGGLTPEAERVVSLLESLAQRQTDDPPAPVAPEPGVLVIDPVARAAVRDGVDMGLTRLEFELLHRLAAQPRRVFTRHDLLADVWEGEEIGGRTVDVHVRRLRLKAGRHPLISTMRGVGYRLHPAARVQVMA